MRMYDEKNRRVQGRTICGCEVNEPSRRAVERAEYVRCGCGEGAAEKTWGLRGYPLASVYSPLQDWREIYDPDTALKRGTVFKELDLPFMGGCSDDCGGGKRGR